MGALAGRDGEEALDLRMQDFRLLAHVGGQPAGALQAWTERRGGQCQQPVERVEGGVGGEILDQVGRLVQAAGYLGGVVRYLPGHRQNDSVQESEEQLVGKRCVMTCRSRWFGY